MRDRREQRRFRLRTGAVMAFPVLLGVAVLARVVILQASEGERLSSIHEGQSKGFFELRSRRGMIRDREDRKLAVTVEMESVFLQPGKLQDPAHALPALASALGVPTATLRPMVFSPRHFVWLRRHADPTLADRVRGLDLKGVGFTKEFKRFWPLGSLGGQILGFTDIDGVGRAGVEHAMDEVLAGRTVRVRGLRDSRRRAIYAGELMRSDWLEGRSIKLTIDAVIQQIAEEEIQRAVEIHGAQRGLALVMAVSTGDILAMAQAPQFDPNGRRKKHSEYRSWAVEEVFEPGSVMKVFTLAAALEAGLVRLDTRIDCERGRYRIGRHTIHDHTHERYLSAKEVVVVSSNIGIAKIAERLGKERLYQALVKMGLHGKTGCGGLHGELRGLLASPKRWSDVQLANVAFGQGIAITPLQLIAALGSVANSGELMRPRLVLQVEDPDHRVIEEVPPRSVGQVLRPEVARAVTEAMVSVVHDKEGTGSRARVAGFQVAGKTGTAQKIDADLKVYVDRWIGSFVGFLPAEAPAIVVLVSLDEPEPDHYGGLVAAPAFARIARRSLSYMGIYGDPSEELAAETAHLSRGPKGPGEQRRRLEGRPRGKSGGSGKALVKLEAAAEEAGSTSSEPPEGLDDRVQVPSFLGLSMRRALGLAEQSRLLIMIEGSGRAASQDPHSGRWVPAGTRCLVRFDSKGGGPR